MLLKDKKIFAFFARKFYFTSFIVASIMALITLMLFFANKNMLYNDVIEKFNANVKFIKHKKADMFAKMESLKATISIVKNNDDIKKIFDSTLNSNTYFEAIFYIKNPHIISSNHNKVSLPSEFLPSSFDEKLKDDFYISNFIFHDGAYRIFVVKKDKSNGYIVAFLDKTFFENIDFFGNKIFLSDENGIIFSSEKQSNIYDIYPKIDISKKREIFLLKDKLGNYKIIFFDKLSDTNFYLYTQKAIFDEFNFVNIVFFVVIIIFFIISYLFFRNFRFLVKNLFLPLDELKRLAMLKHRIKKVSPLISESEFFGEFSNEILEFFNEKIYNLTFDKRFNEIFSKSELCVLITNSQSGMIVQASDTAKKLYGDDICKKNIFEIESIDIFESAVLNFKNTETLINTVHKIDNKFIKISYQKSHFYLNNIAYVMYIIFDNSKYINFLDQILDEYHLIDTSPQLVIKYDKKCEKLINISENSKNILGVSKDKFINANYNFFDFVYRKDVNIMKNKIYNLCMLSIKDDKFIIRLKHKSGTYRHFEVNAFVDNGVVLYMQDIEKFIIKNRENRANIAFYKEIIDTKNIINWRLNIAQEFIKFNDNFYKLLNYDKFNKYEMNLDDFLNFILPDDLSSFKAELDECINGTKQNFKTEIRVKNSLNKIFWLFLQGTIIKKKDNKAIEIGGIIENITELKNSQTKLSLSDSVFNNSLEGIAICNEHWQIIRLNKAFETITGYSKNDIENIFLKELFVDNMFYDNITQALQKKSFFKGENYISNKNGEKIPVILMINELINNKEQFYVIMFSEIAQIKNREQILTNIANIDFLTQIPNRYYFTKIVKNTMQTYDFSQSQIAILFIDFDNFKNINDNFGHEIGDKFLQQAAHRIKDVLRQNDILARLGGDEFGVLIINVKEKFTINRILERISQNLKIEFNINGNIIKSSASIGVALYDGNSQISFEKLLNMADNAMYVVKKNNKGGIHIFDISNAQNLHIKHQQIQKAIANNDFFMLYQPIIATKDCQIDSFELLLRWNNEHIGKLMPKDFLPEIKDIFSEQLLTIFSFEKLIDFLFKSCNKASINISLQQLCNYEFFEFVQDKLMDNVALRKKKIIFEITNFDEKSLENFIDCYEKYLNLGIEFAINNINATNIKLIKKLPIHILKIDTNITLNIGKTFNATNEFKEILKFKNKNFLLVAQGIEDIFIFKALRALNIDYLQGNIIQKATPMEEISKFKDKFTNLQISKFKNEILQDEIINLLDFKTACNELINSYKKQILNLKKFENFKQLFKELQTNFKVTKNSNSKLNTEINKQILDILSTDYENLNDCIFKFGDFFNIFQNELENL